MISLNNNICHSQLKNAVCLKCVWLHVCLIERKHAHTYNYETFWKQMRNLHDMRRCYSKCLSTYIQEIARSVWELLMGPFSLRLKYSRWSFIRGIFCESELLLSVGNRYAVVRAEPVDVFWMSFRILKSNYNLHYFIKLLSGSKMTGKSGNNSL